MREWKDRLGIFASVACAIHCAATPILVASLPTLKFTEWMIDPKLHQVIAIVCSALVALAIWPAFLRFRDYRVLTLSSAGLGLILSAAFLLPDTCCTRPETAMADAAHDGDSHTGHNHTGDSHTGHNHAGDSHADDSHAGHSHAAHSHTAQPESQPESQPGAAESDVSGATQLVLAGVGTLQPWMTPFGGLLLIIAHALNLRRRICRNTACCVGSQSSDSDRDLLPISSELNDRSQSLARAS